MQASIVELTAKCAELELQVTERDALLAEARAFVEQAEMDSTTANTTRCPHGMPIDENVCGICSEGRPNQPQPETGDIQKTAIPPQVLQRRKARTLALLSLSGE